VKFLVCCINASCVYNNCVWRLEENCDRKGLLQNVPFNLQRVCRGEGKLKGVDYTDSCRKMSVELMVVVKLHGLILVRSAVKQVLH